MLVFTWACGWNFVCKNGPCTYPRFNMGLKSSGRCSTRGKQREVRNSDTQRGRPHEDQEMGIMWPQDKELPKPPEAGNGKKEFSLEVMQGAWPYQHPTFRTLAFTAMRELISIVLSHQVCDHLYSSLMRWIHLCMKIIAFQLFYWK